MERRSRRTFLQGAAMFATACATHSHSGSPRHRNRPFALRSLTRDLAGFRPRMLRRLARFWHELDGAACMWGKNVMDLSAAEIEESKRFSLSTTCVLPTLPARFSRRTGRMRHVRLMKRRAPCTERRRPRSSSRTRFWRNRSHWPNNSDGSNSRI